MKLRTKYAHGFDTKTSWGTGFALSSAITGIIFLACAQEDMSDFIPAEDPDLQEQDLLETSSQANTSEDEFEVLAETPSHFDLKEEVIKYKERFKVTDTHSKITDNRGLGFRPLYGTRNVRVVLHGVMYRGGANNRYFYKRRANMNPLPTEGLKNFAKMIF